MSNVSNFDVLKRMATDNKTIMLCPDVLNMKYSDKIKGTRVEIGVPGNPISAILNGEQKAVLLIYGIKQFNELKTEMEAL